MLKTIVALDVNCHLIFNCQIGRGRSTIATITAYLIRYWAHDSPVSIQGDAANWSSQQTNFAITNALVRLLPDGQRIKQQVDFAIDQAAISQNLRWTITSFIKKMEAARTPEEAHDYTIKAASSLDRYIWLIIFNGYLSLSTSPNLVLMAAV